MNIEGADENLLRLEGSHSKPAYQGSRRMNLHISGMCWFRISNDNDVQFTLRKLLLVNIYMLRFAVFL